MNRAQPTPARPDWLVRLPDPRDEEVLSAAFDVFAEKGFHGATMLEIATRARASKKTLYTRFADKADLFRALLAWGCRQNLPDTLPAPETDAERALHAHALAVLTAMLRPESLALTRIVAAEAKRFPEIAAMFDEATRRASIEIVEELGRRLYRSGRIQRPHPGTFADDFIGLVRGDLYFRVLLGAIAPPAPAGLRRHTRRAVRRLLAAYGA